jgi:serine/threonine protein kinase
MTAPAEHDRSSTQTWFIDVAKRRVVPASPRSRDEAPERAPGARIGRYTIREELGHGGMGTVYRAHDPDLARDVALKVIRRGVSDPDRLQRFLGEVLVTARLQHPAIIPVYERGRAEGGELFYTMRLVHGVTLDDVLRRNRAPEPDPGWTPFKLLQVFVGVCRAVAYAHQEGVVHRDLKPSNVMLDDFGGLYVLDWGLARSVGTHLGEPIPESLGEPGAPALASCVVGTPAFMAPEQLRVGPVTPLVDVYGLGGLLYVLLTGREPRTGDQTEALHRILAGELPPAPSDVADGVPPVLEELCRRALAANPAVRLPAASVLADAVQAYLEGRSFTDQGEDADFLRTYRADDYARPSVAVDVVILATPADGPWRIFLQRRPRPPFAGSWACPGTFLAMDEPIRAAAERLLGGEVQATADLRLERLGVYDQVGRDPRTRVISVAHLGIVPTPVEAHAAGGWLEVREEGDRPAVVDADGREVPLAFDHATMLADAVRRVRGRG